MRTRWRLTGRFGTVEVVRRGHLPAGQPRAPLGRTLYFDLAAQLHDPLGQRVVLDMFEAVYGRGSESALLRAGPAEYRRAVLERLRAAFERGDLLVATGAAEHEGTLSAVHQPQDEAPPPEESPREDLTWIEIELVDRDDQPVANQRYVLTLPDGSERRGTTNAQGLARVDRIVAGTCKVAFPDIDAREWEAA